MKNINELLHKIEELREKMNRMISIKNNLQDSEIIEISKLFDEQLVQYHRLLKERTK